MSILDSFGNNHVHLTYLHVHVPHYLGNPNSISSHPFNVHARPATRRDGQSGLQAPPGTRRSQAYSCGIRARSDQTQPRRRLTDELHPHGLRHRQRRADSSNPVQQLRRCHQRRRLRSCRWKRRPRRPALHLLFRKQSRPSGQSKARRSPAAMLVPERLAAYG
jgi:hypothetical protein